MCLLNKLRLLDTREITRVNKLHTYRRYIEAEISPMYTYYNNMSIPIIMEHVIIVIILLTLCRSLANFSEWASYRVRGAGHLVVIFIFHYYNIIIIRRQRHKLYNNIIISSIQLFYVLYIMHII